jgi:hypothetical protein
MKRNRKGTTINSRRRRCVRKGRQGKGERRRRGRRVEGNPLVKRRS